MCPSECGVLHLTLSRLQCRLISDFVDKVNKSQILDLFSCLLLIRLVNSQMPACLGFKILKPKVACSSHKGRTKVILYERKYNVQLHSSQQFIKILIFGNCSEKQQPKNKYLKKYYPVINFLENLLLKIQSQIW